MSSLADAVRGLRVVFAEGQPFNQAFAAMVAAGEAASLEEKDAAILALLDPQGVTHPEIAGYLAMASGALVEQGASTSLGLDAILDQLADGARILAAAGPGLEAAELDGRDPPPAELERDERRWVAAFKLHVIAAMARLARDPGARRRLRAHPGLEAAVRALAARVESNHLYYLVEILDMLDDAPLVVADLRTGRITRHRVLGVRNGFHLMTLLDGKDPHALCAAGERIITAEHGYFTWPALTRTASGWGTKGLGAMLWGESRVVDLPDFEGVRVVLRGEPVFASRSWDIAFVAPLHDALRESLVLERELPAAEAEALLARIAEAAARFDRE